MNSYEPTGLALQIFQSRHASHPNETWAEACERVARCVANAEEGDQRDVWRERFEAALRGNRLMPGGRIWYGAGRARGQMLNCFVIPISDSREGWGRAVSDSIIIAGTGGGVGLAFTPSRPRGSAIRGTGGHATGAVSAMEIINSAGEVIKAGGGRRTALMFALGLSHGDIVEFLDAKLNLQKLNNANVSVVFEEDPAAFFDAVDADGDWLLKHQGREVGTVKARALWNKIVDNALRGGEPGILNGYLANKMSNIHYVEPLTCTNPCQPAWATLLTPDGIRTMGEIQVGDTIWSGKRWTKIVRKLATGVKKVRAYRTRAGTFYGTENHRVVQNGVKIEAQHAEAIDIAVGPQPLEMPLDGDHVLEGLVLGDGTYHEASRKVLLCAGEHEVEEYRAELGDRIRECVGNKRYKCATRTEFLPLTHDRRVPVQYLRAHASVQRAFLRGLYTANGSVVGGRVTLKATSFRVIHDVQQMLSSMGIASYYTVNKEHDVEHHNGVYTSKESYDLNIGTRHGRSLFATLIGFIQQHKNAKLTASLNCSPSTKPNKVTFEITTVEDISEEEVFDITVDADEHTYWTGGVCVSNCGEIWMSPYDCCCLASLVLPRFVSARGVEWESLREHVQLGIRFLDDVLSVNNYPMPEIAAKCAQLRRVGLGIMGLHHMLIELGLRYDSPQGLEFVDKLMKFIKNASYVASINLAREKGPFPAFVADQFLKSQFIKGLRPTIRADIAKYGIRNCAVNTIAPTGTISMVCDVSSGIEPIYSLAYERRFRKGDELAMEEVVDPLFQRYVDDGRETDAFTDALNMPLRAHFEMQATCQRHVDNAVSKTINVWPERTNPQELAGLYREFLPDLKGVTVYPEGTRVDQPLTPLPLERANQLARERSSAGQSGAGTAAEGRNCRSGSCDL